MLTACYCNCCLRRRIYWNRPPYPTQLGELADLVIMQWPLQPYFSRYSMWTI